MLYINFFALFWNISFFLSLSHFIITCSACIWYFGEHKEVGMNPISLSTSWALTYHLGSLALGSLLLAIVWVVRFVAQYLHVASV